MRELNALCCFVTQLCATLCDPMDCSLPGSSVHGILQARILEWIVISFSINALKARKKNKLQQNQLIHHHLLPLSLPPPFNLLFLAFFSALMTLFFATSASFGSVDTSILSIFLLLPFYKAACLSSAAVLLLISPRFSATSPMDRPRCSPLSLASNSE